MDGRLLSIEEPMVLIDEIKRDEGTRLMPYRDTVGKVTIGTGRNLEDRGITSGEADLLLMNDLTLCIENAFRIFPNFSIFPAQAQHVTIGMLFNLGPAGFKKFRKTIGFLRSANWHAAADELMDSKAARQLPERYGRYRDKLKTLPSA